MKEYNNTLSLIKYKNYKKLYLTKYKNQYGGDNFLEWLGKVNINLSNLKIYLDNQIKNIKSKNSELLTQTQINKINDMIKLIITQNNFEQNEIINENDLTISYYYEIENLFEYITDVLEIIQNFFNNINRISKTANNDIYLKHLHDLMLELSRINYDIRDYITIKITNHVINLIDKKSNTTVQPFYNEAPLKIEDIE